MSPWFDPNWRVIYARLYEEMERLRALYRQWCKR